MVGHLADAEQGIRRQKTTNCLKIFVYKKQIVLICENTRLSHKNLP